MAYNDDFCKSPQDAIAKAPEGPRFSTAKGVFGGDEAFPKGASSPILSVKIEDAAFSSQPTDETRGVKG